MFSEITIPNPVQPSMELRQNLEEQEFVLQLNWQERSSRWFLTILDGNRNPLIYCQPLQINQEILGRFKIEDFPLGRLVLVDTSKVFAECGFNDLGDRCRLVYVTSNEVV